jgi:acetylglutamate kinase
VKIVVVVGRIDEIEDAALWKLGRAVRNLVSDSHKLTLIQQLGYDQATDAGIVWREARPRHRNGVRVPRIRAVYQNATREHALSVALRTAGLVTFTLSGLDGQILTLRKCSEPRQPGVYSVEVSAVSPFWLDVMAEKAAVPIFLNAGIDHDGGRCILDAVQLATACAVGWDADALVFLDQDEGVRDHAGSVMRWLEVNGHKDSHDRNSEGSRMLDKVRACGIALRAGVRRGRIFPWSQVASLEDLFRARVEYGTEITSFPLETPKRIRVE